MEQALANLSPSTIAALLVANLLAASKIAGPLAPLWKSLPQRWSVTIPALVALLPLIANFFVDVQTWTDFLVATANAIGLALPGFLTPPAPPSDTKPVAAKPHVFLQNDDGSPVEMRTWPVPAFGVLAFLACLVLPGLTGCGLFSTATAKTAQNIAHDLCVLHYGKQGFSLEDIARSYCKNIDPWVESVLGAEKLAAAKVKAAQP